MSLTQPLKIVAALCFLLVITLIPTSFAASVTFSNEVAKATSAFNAGKISLMIDHGRAALATAEREDATLQLEFMDRLASMCLRAYHIDCALEFGKVFDQKFKSLGNTPENSDLKFWASIQGMNRLIKTATYLGQTESADQFAEDLSNVIGRAPAYNTRTFIEAHLAVAHWKIRAKDFSTAHRHLQAAWIEFLSINDPSDGTLLEYTPLFISLFELAGNTKKAIAINNIVLPYFAQRGGYSGYDLLRAALALHSINVKSNNHDAAILSAMTVVKLMEVIELSAWTKSYFLNAAKALIVIDCSLKSHSECARTDAYAEELSTALRDRQTVSAYPLEDQGSMAIALALHSLGKNAGLSDHIKETLKKVGDEAKSSENSIGPIALYFLARSDGKREESKDRIRVATLEQIKKIREEKKRTLFDITPINNYQRTIFAFFTDAALSLPVISKDDQELIFELTDLDNQSARNVESQYLLLSSQLTNRGERSSLQAYHRLNQDLDRTESRIFSEKVQLRLTNQAVQTKYFKNANIGYRFQNQYDRLDRLTSIVEKVRSRYGSMSLGLRATQQLLTQTERFISHQVVGRFVVTVCASSSEVWIRSAPVNFDRINTSIKILQAALTNPSPPSKEVDSTFPIEASRYLTTVLLSPVRECLVGAKHLITSFNPALSGIPAHVLLDPLAEYGTHSGSTIDFVTVPWVGVRYSLSVLPSYTQLVASRLSKERFTATRPFVGFGDPKLTGLTTNGEARGKVVLRGMNKKVTSSLEELDELPDTSIELKSVYEKFGPKSKIFLRDSATEAAVRREILRDFKVIAFATHGLIREEIEGISEPALVFTPVDSMVAANDGILTATDISRLDLAARLVILSACNSGKFELTLFSSELGGLSTAFLMGGAKTTLASLWSVNSESTSMLMQRFSAEFSANSVSSAEALRKAMWWMLSAPDAPERYKNPRYWAAFSVFGDGGNLLEEPAVPHQFFVKSVESFGREQGHIQDALNVGDTIFLAGGTPNGSSSEQNYIGYLRLVDSDGNTLREHIDRTKFFKIAKEVVGETVPVVAQPSDLKSPVAFEVMLFSKRFDLLDTWTVEREAGEVIVTVLPQKGRNSILVISIDLLNLNDNSRLLLRLIDIKSRSLTRTQTVTLNGRVYSGIKAIELPDGTIKIYSSHMGFPEGKPEHMQELQPSFFGVPQFCAFRYFSTVVSLSPKLEEASPRLLFQDIAIRHMASDERDRPLVFLTRFRTCSTSVLETTVTRLNDNSLDPVKSLELGGIESWPNSVHLRSGKYILVGGAHRFFEEGDVEKWGKQSFSYDMDPVKGHSKEIQSGVFVASLDKEFNVLDFDVLFGALDIFVDGIAEIGEDLLLYGASGDRQFGGRISVGQ